MLHWAGLVAICLAAALAAPAQAAFPGVNGRFAYTGSVAREASPPGGVNTMLPDGTQVRKVADLPFSQNARWSPDGRRIAFTSAGQIFVVNADGRGLRQITNGPAEYESPSWSPNGRELAAGRLSATTGDLVTIDLRTGRERLVVRRGTVFVRWSPQSARIAYVFMGDIHTISPGGGSPRRLTHESAAEATNEEIFTYIPRFDWAPDGRHLVYEQRTAPDCEVCTTTIWRIAANGGARTALVTANAYLNPLWSPDGRTIAYCDGNMDEATNAHPIMRAMTPTGRQLGVLAADTSCADDWQARSRRWQRDWD